MTVACVFVRGPYPYTPEYVIRLELMARKFLARPFRFVCFTDQPKAFTAPIETIAIPPHLPDAPKAIGYWNKLQLFNPAHGLTGRVLFLDLDVLVVSDLAPLVDFPAPFALAADELALTKPARSANSVGLTIVRKFNASAMAWDVGATAGLWHGWTPAVTATLQGDQDWYAERIPDAAAMPVEWFPRISSIGAAGVIPDAAKVVLVKTPKNAIAAKQFPWFAERWGA